MLVIGCWKIYILKTTVNILRDPVIMVNLRPPNLLKVAYMKNWPRQEAKATEKKPNALDWFSLKSAINTSSLLHTIPIMLKSTQNVAEDNIKSIDVGLNSVINLFCLFMKNASTNKATNYIANPI